MACTKKRTAEAPDTKSKKLEITSAAIYDIVSRKVRLEKGVKIPAMIQAKVAVVSDFSGLGMLEPKHDAMRKYWPHVANGSSRPGKSAVPNLF